MTPSAAHQLMTMGKMPNQMVIMGMMMKVGVLSAPTCKPKVELDNTEIHTTTARQHNHTTVVGACCILHMLTEGAE